MNTKTHRVVLSIILALSSLPMKAATGNESQSSIDALLFYLYTGLEANAESWVGSVEKPDINKSNLNGDTPLNLAAKRRFASCAEQLLRKGADPNLGNTNGQAPLHWAALSGDTNLTRSLLAAGARADAKASYGWTPLMVAQARGYQGLAAMLAGNASATPLPLRFQLASKVVGAAREGKTKELRRLFAEGGDANTADYSGAYPLEAAIVSKQISIVRELLASGADPRIPFLYKREALSLAKENGFEEALPLLVSRNSRPRPNP